MLHSFSQYKRMMMQAMILWMSCISLISGMLYKNITHSLPRSSHIAPLASRPFPTGAWWLNLALDSSTKTHQ